MNTEEIDHMLYFKSFSRDPIQFMLIFSYGHPSANLWVRYDQNTGELKRYKVNGDKIIRTDKELTTDPVTHARQTTVYNYLKTEVLLPEE